MRQLFCRDLKAGDVLLRTAAELSQSLKGDNVPGKLRETALHKVIGLGQRLAGQPNAFLAHAAIALDTQFVIEAREAGITANHLAMATRGDKSWMVGNKSCGYYVYRCANAALGRGAATCAKMFFDIAQAGGNMKYDKIGAVKSLFGGANAKSAAEMQTLLDALLKGRNHNFFCSQFVVYVYQLAAYQSGLPAKSLFNISDAKVSPSVLASMLQGNPHFQEAGYMMPDER
jgi:hypothetical protein